jgi:isoleucyl-tRNA synthetase
VLGDWDNPYKTMNFANEAGEIRALAEMVKRGFVFKGLKPVNWCFDCGSALAEAEVEYADKKSRPSTWPSRLPTTPSWPPPSAWPRWPSRPPS